jgi:membrane associated rhomboid family serine protease
MIRAHDGEALGMSAHTSSRIMVLLSVCFGIVVAVLAMTDSGAVGLFAAIGGMVLGLLWVARSMFMKHPE